MEDRNMCARRISAALRRTRTYPIFTPAAERGAWDCDGILTPQVFEAGDAYYMLYAGRKGREWQSGLARAGKAVG